MKRKKNRADLTFPYNLLYLSLQGERGKRDATSSQGLEWMVLGFFCFIIMYSTYLDHDMYKAKDHPEDGNRSGGKSVFVICHDLNRSDKL